MVGFYDRVRRNESAEIHTRIASRAFSDDRTGIGHGIASELDLIAQNRSELPQICIDGFSVYM